MVKEGDLVPASGKCGRQHPPPRPPHHPEAGGSGNETPGEDLRVRRGWRVYNLACSWLWPSPCASP